METLFLDVGFGTSSVILVGSGAAIVIDCGRRTREVTAALHQFSVTRIEHLIVSHWHNDHYGGALGLLRGYSGRIGRVWFPADQRFLETPFWDELQQQTTSGALDENHIDALMVQSDGVRRIWQSADGRAVLEIVSPCYMEMYRGVDAETPNATCGVLLLRVGERVVAFGGDATLSQWRSLNRRVGRVIEADVLAVPHHAGVIWPSNLTPEQIDRALDVLYTSVVRPAAAVISAGTRPGEKHPRADVVRALRRAGARVMCSQMTARCTSDLEAARELQARIVQQSAPGRSVRVPLKKASGKPNHVACAGTVMVQTSEVGTVVHHLAAHDAFVGLIPSSSGRSPMCN